MAVEAMLAEVRQNWPDAEWVASEEGAPRADGGFTRSHLLRTTMKYPLVRIDQDLRRDAQGRDVVMGRHASVADHLIVGVAEGVDAAALARVAEAAGATVRRILPSGRSALLAFPAQPFDVRDRVRSALVRDPAIRVAEADAIVQVIGTPDDAGFDQLWGLHNTGQGGGTADADIDAPEAWDISTGSRSVLVGVIDTGIAAGHPDLAANMWTSPGESGTDSLGRDKRSNGVDDDGNGYVDDWRGWDFYNNDNNPADDHYHGTHCAGTIGAVGGNGTGIAGVCWQVSLVGLKFLSSGGSGTTSDAIEAVLYANAIGCRITSNSWGGGSFSQELKNAIDAAGAQGRLFVAAAGNDGVNNDVYPHYPSSFDCANIIAVGASDRYDARAWFSCYGAMSVDLFAPGVDIYSTLSGNAYGLLSGTSMATPHVAGACALLAAVSPQLTGPQIKAAVLASTDSKAAFSGRCVTGGRLNLGMAALSVAGPRLVADPVTVIEVGDGDGIIEAGETAHVAGVIRSCGNQTVVAPQAALTTADPLVVVTGGTQDLGSMPPGATAAVAWDVTVDGSCPPHAVALVLTCTAASGGPWSMPVTVPVHLVSQITGTVTRLTGGSPIAGALISVDAGERTVVTQADGSYQVSVLEGAHQVACSASGLSPQVRTITTPPAQIADFQLATPDIGTAPAAIALTVEQGATAQAPFTIANTGDQALIWQGAVQGGLDPLSQPACTGLWHATTYRSSSAPSSWYYGQEATRDYETGFANSGSLTFPAVTIGANQRLVFRSWRKAQTGSWYDQSLVQVSVNQGASWTTLAQITDADGTWREKSISLAAYAGRFVSLRWKFDTVNAVDNANEGWYVDDLRLEANPVAAVIRGEELVGGDDIVVSTASAIGLTPSQGSVAAGAEQTVQFAVSAGSAAPGDYHHTIVITSDDLDEPTTSIPATVTVTAAPLVRLVAQSGTDVHAAAHGDGDGFCEPGERIALVPVFCNEGGMPAVDVTATLASVHAQVTVVDGTILVGTLGAGMASVAPAAILDIAPSCPINTTVPVTWAITAGSRTWTAQATLTVVRRSRLAGCATAVDGRPLADVRITAAGQTVLTAADGSYSIAGLASGSITATADLAGHASVAQNLVVPPDVVWNPVLGIRHLAALPARLDLTMPPGGAATASVALSNDGDCATSWTANVAATAFTATTSDQTGGPVFAWTDISTTGTPVTGLGDDGNVGPFPIGFTFPYCGSDRTTFRVCANGWISFSSTATSWSNVLLPNTGAPAEMIAVLWRDLDPGAGGEVDYQLLDADTLAIQFTGVPMRGGATNLVTAQVRLRRSGVVEWHFQRVDNPWQGTVGLQDGPGLRGLTISHNQSGILHGGLAVRATPFPGWLGLSPGSGSILGGAASTLTATVSTAGLSAGVHEGSIVVTSDALDHPSIVIPVRLEVASSADPVVVLAAQSGTDAHPMAIGDGDGFCEPGERIALVPSFRNQGGATAVGLTAVLGSTSSSVTLVGGAVAVGDIAAGVTVTAPAVAIDISSACPVGTEVEVTWTVTDGTRTWTVPASLLVERRSRLTGTITTVGGSPLAGVQVGVAGSNALTASDGTFSIIGLPTGSATATAVKAGYGTATADLTFPPDATWNPVLGSRRLAASPASLDLSVMGSGGASASISLTNAGEAGTAWQVCVAGINASTYAVATSDQVGGPAYQWVDISSTGTPVAGLGDSTNAGPFPVGFAFPFFGRDMTTFRVCSNGWISFSSTSTTAGDVRLPNTGAPPEMIALLWRDLDPGHGGEVDYQLLDADTLAIQFTGVPLRWNSETLMTVQARLRRSGIIEWYFQALP